MVYNWYNYGDRVIQILISYEFLPPILPYRWLPAASFRGFAFLLHAPNDGFKILNIYVGLNILPDFIHRFQISPLGAEPQGFTFSPFRIQTFLESECEDVFFRVQHLQTFFVEYGQIIS